jgi:hypothetical protein
MVARCPVAPTLLFSRWRVLPTPPCLAPVDRVRRLLNFGYGPSMSAPMGWGDALGALLNLILMRCLIVIWQHLDSGVALHLLKFQVGWDFPVIPRPIPP